MINRAIEDLKIRVDKQVERYFKALNKEKDNILRIYEQREVIGALRETIKTCTILYTNDIIGYNESKEITKYIEKALDKIYDEELGL
jgi:hypothetical protein